MADENFTETAEGDGEEMDQINTIFPALLPPLYLHSPNGRLLDTETQLQRNIRLAKLCTLLGLPEYAHDWRLPKAKVLSRPDFSRNQVWVYKQAVTEDQGDSLERAQNEHKRIESHYHVEVRKTGNHFEVNFALLMVPLIL